MQNFASSSCEELSCKHTPKCSFAHPAKSLSFFVTRRRARDSDALFTSSGCLATSSLRALSVPTCELLMSLRTFCVVSSDAGDTPGEVSAETACLLFDACIASTARVAACSRCASSSKVCEPVLSRVGESGRSNSVRFAAQKALNFAAVDGFRWSAQEQAW